MIWHNHTQWCNHRASYWKKLYCHPLISSIILSACSVTGIVEKKLFPYYLLLLFHCLCHFKYSQITPYSSLMRAKYIVLFDLLVIGLSLFLQGFVVSMHKGICEQEFLLAPGLDVLLAYAWVHHGNKAQQISFNHDYNMTFLILPHAFKRQTSWSKQEPLCVWSPFLCHMMTLTKRNVTSQWLSSIDIMEVMLWILTS